MPKRTCAKCGRDKEIRNGVTCENGHFVCSSCKSGQGVLGGSVTLTKCPLCGKRLH